MRPQCKLILHSIFSHKWRSSKVMGFETKHLYEYGLLCFWRWLFRKMVGELEELCAKCFTGVVSDTAKVQGSVESDNSIPFLSYYVLCAGFCVQSCNLYFSLGPGKVVMRTLSSSHTASFSHSVGRGFPADWVVRNPPACAEDAGDTSSISRGDPLEKGLVTCFSILAWEIPWREEPGGLQSMGSQRVRHDWATEHTGKHC